MIVGDPKKAGQCPHDSVECKAFDPLVAYCSRCGRIVQIIPKPDVPFIDITTRELPVNRRVHIPWEDLPTLSSEG